MVNSMHSRRDDETDEKAFESERKTRIGVMKKNRSKEDRLPQPELEDARPDEKDLQRSVCDRKRKLAEVESQSCRRVEVEVHVVREMKPPEKRHLMVRPMPPPQRVIEKDDRYDRGERLWNRHSVKQTNAMAHRPFHNGDQHWRLK